MILLFPQASTARSTTGEADDTIMSRLKTMFMDGAGVREASTTTATRQACAQPEPHRILVAVPPSRRECAGGDGAILKDATLELRWTEPKTCERWNPHKKRGRWKSAKSVRRCD